MMMHEEQEGGSQDGGKGKQEGSSTRQTWSWKRKPPEPEVRLQVSQDEFTT